MSARIIPLSEEFRISLAEYMRKIYPSFTKEYIDYSVNEGILGNQERNTSLIVVDDSMRIVGCHLSFSTKAWIHGKEVPVVWGHDTYLDTEYRREMGMDFVLEIAAIKNGFGLGLSDINVKIQKLIRAMFIDGTRKYCIITPWIIWRKCQSLFKISSKYPVLPNKIVIGSKTFVLCKIPNDISIPNNGYWNKYNCEVDFVRDEEFLNKRFFQNTVHHYYVYTIKGQRCYFVLRPIILKKISALMVVDFRYDYTKPELIHWIFKAIQQVCNEKRLGAILFTTNDDNIKNLYKKSKMCKSYPVAFVGGKENITSNNSLIFLTAADSDDEFHK